MKIICIGKNYPRHNEEMKSQTPDSPVFFLKPDTSLLPKRNPFYYPSFTNELHHEVELVVRINRLGKNISQRFAHKYYKEIGVGIDFTARDLQTKCKEKGYPWEIAKAFDGSCPISPTFIPISEIKDVNSISFSMTKNGEKVQEGNSSQMLFKIDQLIAYVSQFMTLKIGDLLLTGTPSGVGPVNIGDELSCFIEEKKLLQIKIK